MSRLIDADALMADCQLAQKQASRHDREFANAFYSCGGEISTEWWCVEDMIENAPTIEPEQRWIPCSEPPNNAENVFIAHGTKTFLTCCIGHYDNDSGLWYEDRNWFARPIYDGVYWCEMPILPKTEEEKWGK